MDDLTDTRHISRLEIVDTGRRRRWSAAEKLRIVEESFSAPRLASATARRHGISNQLLFAWRKAYREGQEDQLGALGLVTNAVVLWNTVYLQAALAHLQSEGMDINPEDRARLSPLQHKHIHVLGRHSFALADPIASGELRPLNVEGWEDEA